MRDVQEDLNRMVEAGMPGAFVLLVGRGPRRLDGVRDRRLADLATREPMTPGQPPNLSAAVRSGVYR